SSKLWPDNLRQRSKWYPHCPARSFASNMSRLLWWTMAPPRGSRNSRRKSPPVRNGLWQEGRMQIDAPHEVEQGKTLMIVEDEILVAMTLRDELESAGYHVLDLTDRHEEAVAVAHKSTPDLALVNIQLRGRDDG